MYVRLLFSLLSSFVLCLPSTAEPLPMGPQDSWTSSDPIDDAFNALEERRFPAAAEALKRAGKDPMAQYLLGCMHRYGSLGEVDLPQAIKLFKTSAAGKCVDAAVALSELETEAYLEASGVAKRAAKSRAKTALFRSFVLGALPASAELSKLYSAPGAGLQPDKAIAWASIAKAAGVTGAEAMEENLLSKFPASAVDGEASRARIEADVKSARSKSRGVIQVQVPVEMFLPEGQAPGRSGKGGAALDAAYEAANAAFEAKDYEAALRGFQPLAEGGHVEACFYVARIYEMGLAGTKDEAAARRFYLRSAAGGVANAMSNLGFMCHRGSGVAKDPAKAVDYFLMAAYAGGFDGALNIGVAYGTGQGREKDLVESHAWNSIAADLGSEDAQRNLGIAEGEMSQLDKLSAKRRRRDLEAELRGEVAPKYPVPTLQDPGGGAPVEFPAEQPLQEGPVKPAPKVPQAGGWTLEDAMRAFDKGDVAEARRILEIHAERGDAEAMTGLGMLLIDSDPKAALRWLERAYASGAPGAAFSLAMFHYEGELPESTAIEASAWMIKAAEGGDEDAKEMVSGLADEFTGKEIAEIRKRASELPSPGAAPVERPVETPEDVRPVQPEVPPVSPPVDTAVGAMQEFTFKDELLGGMASHTAQIPAGWRVEGGVNWNPQDANAFVNVDAVVSGPDGSQVQFLPSSSFMYFNDLKMQGAPPYPQEGQWNGGSMFLNPGNGPEDFVTRVILRSYRPNAKNVKVTTVGEAAPVSRVFASLMAPMIQQMTGGDQGGGFKATHKAFCPLVRISYTEGGQAFEEEFSFMYLRIDMTGEVQPGKTMTSTMWSVYEARAVRAPQGRLEGSIGMLRGVAGSLRSTRPWGAIVDELSNKLFASPEEFQKLQMGNYEKATGTIRTEARPLTQSLEKVIARTQESWDRQQDIDERVRRAWAEMGVDAGNPAGARPAPTAPRRRGGFRIK